MKKSATVLAAFVFLAAVILNIAPYPKGVVRTEDWVGEQVPLKVAGFSASRTYSMDADVYKVLEPFGIICKVFTSGAKAFDVVVIASANSKSFHDPRICFTSQGMTLKDEQQIMVPTKTHGDVPVTLLSITDQNGGETLAAYFYKGPSGMKAQPKRLMNDLFFKSLTNFKSQEGVFYRFIAQYPRATKEEMTDFMSQFLDQASETSKGYL